MDLITLVHPGMSLETTLLVEEKHSAAHVGSGSLRVLATPIMIGLMESAAHRLLAAHLPDGQASVGSVVNITHLAPTPIGSTVRIRAEVLAIDGQKVEFSVQAWDQIEKIGQGVHQRMVIDEARFLKRVSKKAITAQDAAQGGTP